MKISDEWSSSEDGLLVAALRRNQDWDSIADSLLRTTREVIERAGFLQRAANAKAATKPAATPRPAPVPEPTPEPQQATNVGKGGNGAGRTWTVKQTGVCEICGKHIEWDDGPRRRYCSPEHMLEANRRRAAQRWRDQRDLQAARDARAAFEAGPPPELDKPSSAPAPAPEPVEAPIKAKPAKVRPKVVPGGCKATHAGHQCILRVRHRGEHLTDNAIIFSRDGKDVWPDTGDVYLMMALNNDMVAPQVSSPPPG